jgi:hypothetical protein
MYSPGFAVYIALGVTGMPQFAAWSNQRNLTVSPDTLSLNPNLARHREQHKSVDK